MKTALLAFLAARPWRLGNTKRPKSWCRCAMARKLHTVLFAPKDQAGPLPILFVRTPYGAIGEEKALLSQYPELTAEGYVFAFQDIRGRFTSEGQFVMQRQVRDKRIRRRSMRAPMHMTASTGLSGM